MNAGEPERVKRANAQEDYLEALLAMGTQHGQGVPLTELAGRLGISPASASEVVKRLQDAGCVARGPRGRIRLTEAGLGCAERVAERHRVIKRFFTDVLHVPPEIAERDACRAEHALHAETCARLEDFLEHLEADALERDGSVALTLLQKGQSGTLVRIAGGQGARIRLAGLGVRPGVHLQVLQNSGHAPVMVRVGNARVAIGRRLATRLHITLDKGASEP